jgi:hypothetical protein
MEKLPVFLRRLLNKFYYGPLLKSLNESLYLQHRPAFDFKMDDDPGVPWDLYNLLKSRDWEHDRFDFVRYYSLYLILNRLQKGPVPGDIVELGVYRGNTADFMKKKCDRHLHLFDTFSGFDQRDSKQYADAKLFQNTSLDAIKKRLGTTGVSYYPGYFPESAKEFPRDRVIALVHIDVDLYEPISKALDYFYPQLHRNGYIVVHDYNNIKMWELGAQRAVDEFVARVGAAIVELPDKFCSVVIVKR